MKNTVASILASYPHDAKGAEEKLVALLSEHDDPAQLKPFLHALPPFLASMDNGNKAHAVSVAKHALKACGNAPHLIEGFIKQLFEIFPVERLKNETVFLPLVLTMRLACEKGMRVLEGKRSDGFRLINYSLRSHHDVLSDVLKLPRTPRMAASGSGTFFRQHAIH
jgi:hypothetical protein